MKVIPPVPILDASLVSSTVAEPDATALGDGVGTAAWNSATAYTVGQKCYLAATHRVYQAAVANTNKPPLTNLAAVGATPATWVDMGPTNRWKMLRSDANYQTVTGTNLVVLLTPGVRVSTLAMIGVEADNVLVEVLNSVNTVIYSHAESMRARETLTWSDYFFGTFMYKSSLLLIDIPLDVGIKIRITLTKATGNVKAGPVVYGTPVDLGKVGLGAQRGAVDFSRVTRDTFGQATMIPRKAVPRTQQTTKVEKAYVDRITRTLNDLRAKTAMWVGIEDDDNAYFDALCVLGFAKDWTLSFDQVEFCYLSLTLEGL